MYGIMFKMENVIAESYYHKYVYFFLNKNAWKAYVYVDRLRDLRACNKPSPPRAVISGLVNRRNSDIKKES